MTTASAGSADPTAPLVVLLHGRGADESSIIGLAEALPDELAYVAPRARIPAPPGWAWFENRGIGRPTADSLRVEIDALRAWIDETAGARPVTLVGFSGGAAMAGGLLLDDPARFAGVALLYGTLPFDAGLPTTPGRLGGVEVFHAQPIDDGVIPSELLEATWEYLTRESEATLVTHRHRGGHAISPEVAGSLAFWLTRVTSA
jgi:phospholipase/carboxylesterase